MKEKLLTSFQTLNSDLSVDLFQSYYKHIITSTADESQYTERHHILPKAIFPEYKSESWNIVKLSAKDHFLAHYLLFKMFPKHPKIVAAMWGMCNQISPNHQREFLEEHKDELAGIYEEARLAHSKQVSIRMSGPINPMKGKTGRKSPFYGKKRPKDVVEKMKANHWSNWRKPWNHNKARKDAWLLACDAYDLWLTHNCGYVRLDTSLNKSAQTFKTIHQHFKKGWNPHTDNEFQQWLSSFDTNDLS